MSICHSCRRVRCVMGRFSATRRARSRKPAARKCAPPSAPALLLLLLALLPVHSAAQPVAVVVADKPAGSQVSLMAALLRQDVSTIELATDVSAAAALSSLGDDPLTIQRCVRSLCVRVCPCAFAIRRALQKRRAPPHSLTTKRQPSHHTQPNPTRPPSPTRNLTLRSLDPSSPRILDLNLLNNKLRVCSACTLTLRHLAVANDRAGAGGSIDAVSADPWGRVELRDAVRLRSACVPSTTGVAQISLQPRSPQYPGGAQRSRVIDATFRGAPYPGSLQADDAAVRVEPLVGPGGWTGGYDLLMFNTTRLCARYVDPACLQAGASGDTCVLELMGVVGQGGGGRQSGRAVAAVVAAVVIGRRWGWAGVGWAGDVDLIWLQVSGG